MTGTDNDDNGGDATKIAASYAMGNGLTLKGSVEDESLASGGEDEQTVGFSYAMDALTVGYTAIKPGEVAGADAFGDEWDFHLSTLQATWLHHSQSTKQTRLQSSLITHSVAAHLLSQQCTTKLVQLTT